MMPRKSVENPAYLDDPVLDYLFGSVFNANGQGIRAPAPALGNAIRWIQPNLQAKATKIANSRPPSWFC